MRKAQKIVLAAYCLLFAYCCLWIPWCISNRNVTCERVGFGWLWAGPGPALRRDIFDRITEAPIPPPPRGFTLDSERTWERARPDLELIAFRLAAATAISGAAFLLAGMFRSSATLS
jgi:hypothetical protein